MAQLEYEERAGRKGPQDHMDVQIATQNLAAGSYELLISQQDEKKHRVEFKILPNPPKIDNLPILVNQGAETQHFVLKGERLGLITKLEAAGALLSLNPPAPNQTERSLTVQLKSSPKPGTAVCVKAYLQDRVEPLMLTDALETTGPLPVIASSKLSRPTDVGVSIRFDEFPAGDTLNAMLDVKNLERKGVGGKTWIGTQTPCPRADTTSGRRGRNPALLMAKMGILQRHPEATTDWGPLIT